MKNLDDGLHCIIIQYLEADLILDFYTATLSYQTIQQNN